MHMVSTHWSTHKYGSDCVACETNSMLVGNFGTDRADFEADQDWWVVCTTNSNKSPNKSNLYSWYISLSC